jgi:hypothetical protein
MVTSSAPGVPTFSRRVFAMHDNGYWNLSDHDSFASGVPHETLTPSFYEPQYDLHGPSIEMQIVDLTLL